MARSTVRTFVVALSMSFAAVACSSNSETVDGGVTDSGLADTFVDAPSTSDAGTDATSGPRAEAVFGTHRATIGRSYVGYTVPTGASEPTELYVDLDFLPNAGCPTTVDGAGAPKKITALLPLPLAASYTKASVGASASFVDTDNTDPWLTGAPNERATAFTITPRASSLTSSGFVDLDLVITFPSGTVTGSVHAPHCAIFDGT